jgi:esterase/lipase superfamily enzyme
VTAGRPFAPTVARLAIALCALALFSMASTRGADARCALPTGNAVAFATDREPATDAQLFTGERGIDRRRATQMSYGLLREPADRTTLVRCSSAAEFVRAVGGGFPAARAKRILIVIHGYYTPFRTAATDALALRKALNFTGPVVLFSWPAKTTSRLAYLKDETNAAWAMPHFRTLLGTLRRAYPTATFSFASHSLGSRFAAEGIASLRESGCAHCLDRSVFFAPDIDSTTLHEELTAAKTCSGRPPETPAKAALVTLYVSNNDLALRQSQKVHGHQRAGQAGSELIVCGGVDTIDVSRFKGSDKAGHGYFVDARIAADARAAVAGTAPTAPARKLKAVRRGDGGRYYELNS